MSEATFLVVDDNNADRYILIRQLKAAGYNANIVEMSHGEEALEYLVNGHAEGHVKDGFPPSLIFLDINMPLMTGLEFLKHLMELARTDDFYGSIPVTMFTSSSRSEDVANSMQHSIVKNYLVKGEAAPGVIKNAVEEALGLAG